MYVFPTCQLLEFIRALLLLVPPPPPGLLNRKRQIAVGTTGPQPQGPERSGHYRSSTASARSQWALPDLNRKCQIAVRTTRNQPRVPNLSGLYWTSHNTQPHFIATNTWHNTQPTKNTMTQPQCTNRQPQAQSQTHSKHCHKRTHNHSHTTTNTQPQHSDIGFQLAQVPGKVVKERQGERSKNLKMFQQWFCAHLQFTNARQQKSQVRRFGVPNRYHQHTSSVFVGARLDGLLAPPASNITRGKRTLRNRV